MFSPVCRCDRGTRESHYRYQRTALNARTDADEVFHKVKSAQLLFSLFHSLMFFFLFSSEAVFCAINVLVRREQKTSQISTS